ncbi:MAG: hypothetical protein JWN26_513 [Candidatus Saccharibacteria bacterium]|nr:hypothetical protein [Candidatus Saccharibacteria bacterium]
MVDALASGASVLRDVEVRVFSRVPQQSPGHLVGFLLRMNHRGYMAKSKNTIFKGLLKTLDTLSSKRVALIFAAIGFITFIVCLNNPFQGDDITQIVENLPVHFIQNIGYFFTSSTFYNGQNLVGTYYRPLMTTAFSILYTLFQTSTAGYHIFQIALFSSGAFVLFLVLKRFVRQWLALLLALIFLVHPMNSQIVFSIACLQDTLMFFFGILALYVLITRTSWRSMIVVAVLLLLTLFCKESGLAYVVMSFAYLGFFDRKRIWKLIVVMAGPVVLYLTLKALAVGLLVGNANGAPIDHLSFGVRLLTSPSIVQFYFGKFVFPLSLSTCWYWTEQHFSTLGVLIPFLVDLAIAAVFVWLGRFVKRYGKRKDLYAYIFFACWTVLGIIPYLQITPLDMTACETWFCFSMIGVLAMLGLSLPLVKIGRWKINLSWVLIVLIIAVSAFAVRTIVRGTNYSSQYNIAVHDLAVSQNDYSALNNIAQYMIDNQRYVEAKQYAQKSIAIFPGLGNYDNLGVAHQQMGDYKQAIDSYNTALSYGSMDFVYENLAQIYLAKWQDPTTEKFLQKALTQYPQDYKLLTYMAILKGAQGNNTSAQGYITKAAQYGAVPQLLYDRIVQNQPLVFSIPTSIEPIILK